MPQYLVWLWVLPQCKRAIGCLYEYRCCDHVRLYRMHFVKQEKCERCYVCDVLWKLWLPVCVYNANASASIWFWGWFQCISIWLCDIHNCGMGNTSLCYVQLPLFIYWLSLQVHSENVWYLLSIYWKHLVPVAIVTWYWIVRHCVASQCTHCKRCVFVCKESITIVIVLHVEVPRHNNWWVFF